MKYWIIIVIILGINNLLNAQVQPIPYDINNPMLPQWVQLMYNNSSPVQVKKAYEDYYKYNPFVKNQHTQYYKRWERQFARKPYWQAMTEEQKKNYQEQLYAYLKKKQQQSSNRSPSSNWQGIGPFDFDKTAASTSYACGAAHVYTVKKAMSNNNILYAGTATAGVWKSIDNGANWTLCTRDYFITTVQALEIAHNTPNTVYASSDFDGKVHKTTDGGLTWQQTGDPTFNAQVHSIPDIVMHPTFSNVVLLASNNGLYRTNNSGSSWTQIMSGSFQEIEFHPYQPNIVYAIKQVNNKTEFYKSIDHGLTFTLKTNGWPVLGALDEQKRTEITVSPADSNKIYAVLTGTANFASGLFGIFVSNDAGESWSSLCCGAHLPNFTTASNPNIMHWSDAGTGNGGQYYYDLALACSPNNADSVLVGGINLWMSGDGANNFSCPAQWDHSYKSNYIHADIHDIRFYDNEIWVACDGGIFYSTDNGVSFQRRMKGIEGTDFWGFGAGFQDGEVMLGGTYHNGTLLKDNSVYTNGWVSTDGGDNYRGFVHPVHKRLAYSDYGKKLLSGNRMIPNSNSSFAHLPHGAFTPGFSGNIAFHPLLYNTLLSTEYYRLWKTKNNGLTWDLLYNFGSGLMTSLEISWSNPDVLYLNYHPSSATAERKIYRSSDGGYNWVDISPDSSIIPQDRHIGYNLAISPTDENIIWAARVSPYEGLPILDGYQVFKSIDGGQTWQNISTSDLDGVYITNIEHQKGSNGGIYLGTRNAVYYKNDNMTNWDLFSNNLPARTHSVNLAPYYKEGKLRNGTNRSVYECNFYENSPPIAQISVDKKNSYCTRDTFYFANHSVARNNATYLWQFAGGNPNTSTAENPKVVFTSPGSYSITLTVNDSLGTHSQVLSNYISISNDCLIDTIPGYALQLNSNNDYIQTAALNLQSNEITLSAWVKPDGIQNQYTGIISHSNDTFPAGLLFGNNNELIFQWPGAQWTWNSGLFVPVDEWSHVAVSISADSATVYLNGIPSSYVANLSSFHWKDAVNIGRYAHWPTRNFIGLIDEVSIWDKSLSQDDIRATQHLTKYQAFEPNLIHYYQFNANTPLVQDRIGSLHAEFIGGANRGLSTAPIGGGRSQKIVINNSGNYNSPFTFSQLHFSNTGTIPNGELIVNRINVTPDQIPNNYLATNGYWVINNYGLNQSFSALDSFLFSSTNLLNYSSTNYTLYQRTTRAEGNTWNSPIDSCDMIKNNKHLVFSDGLLCNSFGQFAISSDSSILVPNQFLTKSTFPNDISVYPNPIASKQVLNIQMQHLDKYRFVLYDISGKEVFRTSFYNSKLKISLPTLAQGIYSYQVSSERKRYNGLIRVINKS